MDNQSPIFLDIDLWQTDRPLREAVAREAPGMSHDLAAFGRASGTGERFDLGRQANLHPPVLKAWDEKGRRLDEVEFHPAYHRLMEEGMAAGLHSSTWQGDSHVVRGARLYLAAQAECGHICPLTMTHAAVAVLREVPELAASWLPKILGRRYDPRSRPIEEKSAATVGMGMTERQGGTDLRANITVAERTGADGTYRVNGHKWFMSAPMSDAFVVLAQAEAGLTCFLLPRVLPDGVRNALHFQRLKDKLGNRANASSEVEFSGALAWRIGEEGRGIATILRMVTLTRLDCAMASAALMRLGLASAIHHARHRSAFGRKLADQPLMRAVLADLALDVEAATALVFRLARAFDAADDDPAEAAYARVLTPVVKYWVCKRAPVMLYEAMECLGGNGYVEDGLLARAYREAPVNAIWEGSGNVMALDLLRALKRDPSGFGSVLEELAVQATGNRDLAAAVAAFERIDPADVEEAEARRLADRLARVTAACLLAASAPDVVGQAFAARRLFGDGQGTFTGVADPLAAAALVERAFPGGP